MKYILINLKHNELVKGSGGYLDGNKVYSFNDILTNEKIYLKLGKRSKIGAAIRENKDNQMLLSCTDAGTDTIISGSEVVTIPVLDNVMVPPDHIKKKIIHDHPEAFI
jgi:hypothetical protein